MTTDSPAVPRKRGLVDSAVPTRRITWLTVLGLVLVPVTIGGLLVAGLWNPADRLGDMTAAIVNDDEPVTLDGQTVPLGRQLTAGLVGADDDNFTWVLTDADDAARGLDSGDYAVVVTIPEDFSADATSAAGEPQDVERATIDVRSSDRSALVDEAIGTAIVAAATSAFNDALSAQFLDNIYLGFETIATGVGDAADGARELATGVDELSGGIAEFSAGTDEFAAGLGELARGADQAADGGDELAQGAAGVAGGARDLADGLSALQSSLAQAGASASSASASSTVVAGGLATLLPALQNPDSCGAADPGCQQTIAAAASALGGVDLTQFVTDIQTTDAYLNGVPGTPGLVDGAAGAAAGAQELAAGASGLSTGTREYADGIGELSNGASASAAGAAELASGATALSDGAEQLADGADELATGLATAADEIPVYSAGERETLAEAVASPLEPLEPAADIFGTTGIALFAALALWIGGLVTYLIVRPVPRSALGSSRSSARLALASLAPGVAIGAVQGIAVGVLMLGVLEIDAAARVGFVLLAALTGVSFAAVQQGLAALLGGIGRFAALVIAVIALAAGIVSTTPAWFDAVLGGLPLGSAFAGLQAITNELGAAPAWASAAALVGWGLLGLGASAVAVSRLRTVRLGRPALAD